MYPGASAVQPPTNPVQMIWDAVCQITPQDICRGVKNGIKTLSNRSRNLNSITNLFISISEYFKSLPQISENTLGAIRACRLVNLGLIPFKVARICTHVIKIVTADRLPQALRSSVECVSDTGLLIGSILNGVQILNVIRVLSTPPLTALFNAIVLPCVGLRVVLESWDLFKTTKTFWLITSGSRSIKTEDAARQELEKLKKEDLACMKRRLNLSRQCGLAEKIDSLLEKLTSGEKGALDEVADFYRKMRERVYLRLPLAVANLALDIASLAGSILSIALPGMPLIGGVVTAVSACISGPVRNMEYYFMKRDIFDPAAQSRAEYYYTTTISVAKRIIKMVSVVFTSSAPSLFANTCSS